MGTLWKDFDLNGWGPPAPALSWPLNPVIGASGTPAKVVLSGTQAIALHLEEYVATTPVPGKEGGITEFEGRKLNRLQIHGFSESGDIDKDKLNSFVGTTQWLQIPSTQSGSWFFSGRFLVNDFHIFPIPGKSYPFYQWIIDGLATGVGGRLSQISGAVQVSGAIQVSGAVQVSGIVYIQGSGGNTITDYSGALNVNISGGTISVNISGNGVQLGAYDYSGANEVRIGTITSGAPILRMGNIWSYTQNSIGASGSVVTVTSGYTILHSIIFYPVPLSIGLNSWRPIIADATSGSRGVGNTIFDTGGLWGHSGSYPFTFPVQLYYDIEVFSGVVINQFQASGTPVIPFIAIYRQAPL